MAVVRPHAPLRVTGRRAALLSARPQTSSFRAVYGLSVQPVVLSFVGSSSSLCELLVSSCCSCEAARFVCSGGRRGDGSLKNPYRFGVDLPSFRRRYRPRALPRAVGADPHYHDDAEVGGVGSARLEPRSSLGISARCRWLSMTKVWMGRGHVACPFGCYPPCYCSPLSVRLSASQILQL